MTVLDVQGQVEEDYLSRLNAAMTTIRGVNRTNVLTLGRTFKSAAGMMQARAVSARIGHANVGVSSCDRMATKLNGLLSQQASPEMTLRWCVMFTMMQASMEELSACPGIGPTKVRRLYETFHEPFRRTLQRQQPPVVDAGSGASAGVQGEVAEVSLQQQPQQQQQQTAPAVANDAIAEIGGDENEIEDTPFAFM